VGIYVGGQEYDKAYMGGVEFTGALVGGEQYLAAAAPDQPGTLTHGVTLKAGRGINIATIISDPDGIASVDSSTLTASDGRTSDVSTNWMRRDANSFTHTDERDNNRWRVGSMVLTYTDSNGVQSTLTASWDVRP